MLRFSYKYYLLSFERISKDTMTFQQINYALTIADVGSMNKAAEKLFISQPTLSSSIKELENELEITIFIRNSKGVSLTPEGSDFLSNARQVYQQYLSLIHI